MLKLHLRYKHERGSSFNTSAGAQAALLKWMLFSKAKWKHVLSVIQFPCYI